MSDNMVPLAVEEDFNLDDDENQELVEEVNLSLIPGDSQISSDIVKKTALFGHPTSFSERGVKCFGKGEAGENQELKSVCRSYARNPEDLKETHSCWPLSLDGKLGLPEQRRDLVEPILELNRNEDCFRQINRKPIMKRLQEFFLQKRIQIPRPKMEDFYFLRVLGEGAMGYVAVAKEVTSGRYLAMKVVGRREVLKRNLLPVICRERDILYNLTYLKGGHPMVMQIYYTFSTRNHYFFALQYASMGSLSSLLKENRRFNLEATLFFTSEIIVALEWLHRCLVIHRDLKPQNILVKNDYHILISDFSSAKDLDPRNEYGELPLRSDEEDDEEDGLKKTRSKRSTFVGTALYISPEVLDRREVTPTCDYWAFGCILFEMLTSRSPFAAPNALECIEKIRKLNYTIPSLFPPLAKDLVKKLLVQNPKSRLGAKGTHEIMEHQFFSGTDWDSLLEKVPPTSIRSPRDAPGELLVPANAKPGLNAIEESRLMGIDTHFHRFASLSEGKSTVMARKSKVDIERDFLLSEQRKKNRYHRFVNDKLIVKQGILEKKKGLFSRARMFLLTDGPDLWYVEPDHLVLKGKVPFTKQMKTEIVNFGLFFIHTPYRTYYLSDPNLEADRWALAIDNMQKAHWDELEEEQLPEREPPRSGRYAIWVR